MLLIRIQLDVSISIFFSAFQIGVNHKRDAFLSVVAEVQPLVVFTGQSDRAIVFHSLLRGSPCHEGSSGIEKRSHSLSLHFYPMPWNFLTKFEKYCASWLSAYHHGLQQENGMIPYSMTKRVITMAVIGAEESDDNKPLIYVKNVNDWLIYSIATTQPFRPQMLIMKIQILYII